MASLAAYRVIYYWRAHAGEIWMLTIYAKSEEQSIPAHVLKALKREFEPWSGAISVRSCWKRFARSKAAREGA